VLVPVVGVASVVVQCCHNGQQGEQRQKAEDNHASEIRERDDEPERKDESA